MKKLLLIAFVVLAMVGCDYKNPDGSYDTSRSLSFETIVIDSCEYISALYTLAHKGNCKFCAERRERMSAITIGSPSAMDVYRGKTTLEITYKDGIPVDSVVVFKNN